jgi:hypothetical protein
MNVDIRSLGNAEVTRIQFADDVTYRGMYIVKKPDGEVTVEDQDLDGVDRGIDAGDVDNYIKAREYARSLGWKI